MVCKCGGNIEYTVAKDMATKIILIQAKCTNCGKIKSGWGFKVEDIMEELEKKWNKKTTIPRRQRRSYSERKMAGATQASL